METEMGRECRCGMWPEKREERREKREENVEVNED
jgi:hypothetical protein